MGTVPELIGSTNTKEMKAALLNSPNLEGGLARKRRGTPKLTAPTGLIEGKSEATSSLNQESTSGESKSQFRDEDMILVKNLGAGTGGTVSLVIHGPSGIKMARKQMKTVATDENMQQVEKQIMRELRIMRKVKCPYIVAFYGAFVHDGNLNIMMEYMDLGTLESVSKRTGPIPEQWIATMGYQLIKGMVYLFDTHKIVHRDIKPANVLVASNGFAKLSDFGASKETAETLAMTFIGTQCYLSPERIIRNAPCTIKSDIWAFALTLMEVATAKFPFPSEAMTSYFDLMQYITQEQSPTLPPKLFTPEFEEFCRMSLIKDPEARADIHELIV